MDEELLNEELSKIKSGNCPYYDHVWKSSGLSCSPFSGGCNSGVDENGNVYCDRLIAKSLNNKEKYKNKVEIQQK